MIVNLDLWEQAASVEPGARLGPRAVLAIEVDAEHVVVATLATLAQQGQLEPGIVNRAIQEFGIGPDYLEPWRQ
jgi:pyruvate dehydrogenase complex dehydrogenase (E1) component